MKPAVGLDVRADIVALDRIAHRVRQQNERLGVRQAPLRQGDQRVPLEQHAERKDILHILERGGFNSESHDFAWL